MTISEKHLITFISKSGIILGGLSTIVYAILGVWLDSVCGAITTVFFSIVLYMVLNKYISYSKASILSIVFTMFMVINGFVTAISIADGLIYIVIPTIIVTLLRPDNEHIKWLIPYYGVFLILNFIEIPNNQISMSVFIQLFGVHMILFLGIGYFKRQERKMAEELILLNKQLQEDATIDTLTGAYNRRTFNTVLDKAISTKITKSKDTVLVMIDIDHFKLINDNYGHQKGDEVLQRLVTHLKSKVRSTDVVIRYGGEEFIIFFDNIDYDKALYIMEEIRKSVEDFVFIEDKKITISIGISKLEVEDTSAMILSRADKALYKSKETGRNKISEG